MSRWNVLISLLCLTWVVYAQADDTLYRYEGDVLPYDESAGWAVFNACESPCSESLEDGHFVLTWAEPADIANFSYRIAEPPDPPPPTLWVEWQYRSNHPFFWIFPSCDGRSSVKYGGMHDVVYMYGDTSISFSGDDVVSGLNINEFHTYRFESLDGINYRIAVDGLVFMLDADDNPNGYHSVQLGGSGGCGSQQVPNMKNEWDFVRYGTISFGEQVVSTDPPSGFLDPGTYADLDRFTVTFDSANYVYIDDITVQVTGGTAPVVTQTRRRENDEPDTVEIVLDRPLPSGQLTRFFLNDGETTNVVEYSFVTTTTGACCTPARACFDLTPTGCAAIEGAEYRGDGTACAGGGVARPDLHRDGGHDSPRGGNHSSGEMSSPTSEETGHPYIDETCADLFNIPATSPWGLAITTVLILALGTFAIKRQGRWE